MDLQPQKEVSKKSKNKKAKVTPVVKPQIRISIPISMLSNKDSLTKGNGSILGKRKLPPQETLLPPRPPLPLVKEVGVLCHIVTTVTDKSVQTERILNPKRNELNLISYIRDKQMSPFKVMSLINAHHLQEKLPAIEEPVEIEAPEVQPSSDRSAIKSVETKLDQISNANKKHLMNVYNIGVHAANLLGNSETLNIIPTRSASQQQTEEITRKIKETEPITDDKIIKRYVNTTIQQLIKVGLLPVERVHPQLAPAFSASTGVQAPVQAPVPAPMQVPLQASVSTPMQAPVQAPMHALMRTPVQASVQASMQALVQGPVRAQMSSMQDLERAPKRSRPNKENSVVVPTEFSGPQSRSTRTTTNAMQAMPTYPCHMPCYDRPYITMHQSDYVNPVSEQIATARPTGTDANNVNLPSQSHQLVQYRGWSRPGHAQPVTQEHPEQYHHQSGMERDIHQRLDAQNYYRMSEQRQMDLYQQMLAQQQLNDYNRRARERDPTEYPNTHWDSSHRRPH